MQYLNFNSTIIIIIAKHRHDYLLPNLVITKYLANSSPLSLIALENFSAHQSVDFYQLESQNYQQKKLYEHSHKQTALFCFPPMHFPPSHCQTHAHTLIHRFSIFAACKIWKSKFFRKLIATYQKLFLWRQTRWWYTRIVVWLIKLLILFQSIGVRFSVSFVQSTNSYKFYQIA